ncbi:7194_t:CDS:2, partial [Funneliformis geosporum]
SELIYNISNGNILVLEAGPPNALIIDIKDIEYKIKKCPALSNLQKYYLIKVPVKRLITIVDKIWDYKAFKAIENNARKNTDEEFKSILDLMVYSCTRTTKQDGNRCSLADRYLTDALKKVHNAFIAPPKGEMIIRGGTINRAQ